MAQSRGKAKQYKKHKHKTKTNQCKKFGIELTIFSDHSTNYRKISDKKLKSAKKLLLA